MDCSQNKSSISVSIYIKLEILLCLCFHVCTRLDQSIDNISMIINSGPSKSSITKSFVSNTHLYLFAIFTFARFPIKELTISVWPNFEAIMRAVSLSLSLKPNHYLSLASTFALWSSNFIAISLWPKRAAIMSAVLPPLPITNALYLGTISMFAPCLINVLTISKWPLAAAKKTAVSPYLFQSITLFTCQIFQYLLFFQLKYRQYLYGRI